MATFLLVTATLAMVIGCVGLVAGCMPRRTKRQKARRASVPAHYQGSKLIRWSLSTDGEDVTSHRSASAISPYREPYAPVWPRGVCSSEPERRGQELTMTKSPARGKAEETQRCGGRPGHHI